MDKKRITGKYILIYSAVFLLLCAVVFAPFALDGRCLVGNGDGQSQYILQLEYMGRWLRQALGGILHGDFTPARFDFSIGMGDDITSVVRFHPLDFLAVFVPEAGTELLYQFLIFFRLYLAGIAFSAYAFAWKRMAGGDADQGQRYDSWAVLAGSMVYLFTGYTYCLGIVHPTYLSPLITLPLLLLGAERMLHREEEHRFVLFSVMTAVSFISNYYFMYIASVAAVLYVFVRFFQIYKENRIRKFVIVFVRFTAAYVTGTLIACITLLPVLKRYAGSYHSQHLTSLSNLLVYADKRRYVAWLINLISPLRASGNGTHLNYVVLVIPALILLFFVRAKGEQESGRGKERIFLRICALILLAFLLIPAGGFLLAAMNNENNRWVFLIALLCGGVVSFSFPDFFRLQKRQTTALALGCIVYDLAVAAAAVLFGYDRYPVVGAVQLTAVTLFLLLGRKAAARTLCVSLTGICAVSVMINGIMTFAKPFGNLPRYYRHAQDSLAWYRDSVYANYLKIPGTDAIGFYRVDGVFPGNREDNAALLLGYPGIQMYNSVIPLMLTNTFHLDETFSGMIMAADNVLALFLLPFFGSLSDRCHSRLGRRMPFILVGTALAVVGMVFLPIIDNAYYSDGSGALLAAFIGVLLFVLVAMGTYRSPAVALMPDCTPKPLRSPANAIINLMGAVGGIIYLGIASVLYNKGRTAGLDHVDYLPLFVIVAAIMVASVCDCCCHHGGLGGHRVSHREGAQA